ncbi:MAG TPA: adenine deaminase C-terminal domain-containing protein [Solirubrobacteraceae bacterium]|nr:adenine deaminase C-terminal domain-containing protein [Solirubrobacteraceae bacterium]
MSRSALLDVALGRSPADLVVEGGTLVNVLTGEIYPADVAIVGDTIAATGSVDGMIGADTIRVRADAKHIVPGLIDEHLHTYETHLTPAALAPAMLTHGVTTIATDFYGEAVVAGRSAIQLQLQLAKALPMNVLWTLPMPAFYQDQPFLHTGSLTAEDMRAMLAWPECIGVNECFAGFVLGRDEVMLELMELARDLGKILCGHASEVRGRDAAAWAAYGGYLDDHECVDPDEVIEKARAGVRIVLREGSGVSDVVNCLPAITRAGLDPRRFSFCSDLLSPVDLLRRGDIDYCVRLAIEAGVPAIDAIRMGSLNAAETLGVERWLGSVAPGKQADLCLVAEPLERFAITDVIAKGRVVVAEGEYRGPVAIPEYPAEVRQTVKLAATPTAQTFAIPASPGGALVRVIEVSDGSLITDELHMELPVRDGVYVPEPASAVNKVASFERHGKTGLVGLGFVSGYGLRAGAVASTYNPHCQNLIAVGADDHDMATVASTVAEMGGGFAVVRDGQVLASVPLPLYGLLSDRPAEELVAQIEAAIEAIRSLGSELSAPFHTLAFLGLPVVIGKLKICSLGLIDVWASEVVGLEIPAAASA